MAPIGCNGIFQLFDGSNADSTTYAEIDKILESRGVTLDFSKATSLHTTFTNARVKSIGKIDGSTASSWYMTFYGCRAEIIQELVFNSKSSFTDTFTGAKWLKEIETVSGTIANSISFADCPLVKASIESLFNALSTTTTGKTATFNKAAVTAAFGSTEAEEWLALVATRQNWTISLA